MEALGTALMAAMAPVNTAQHAEFSLFSVTVFGAAIAAQHELFWLASGSWCLFAAGTPTNAAFLFPPLSAARTVLCSLF